MTTIQSINQINSRATSVLIKHMGVADTLRFLSQFRTGSGDYTAERKHFFEGVSVRQLADEIRKHGNQQNESQ
ncbi:hypothetical protein [Desulfonatronum parangueonense]